MAPGGHALLLLHRGTRRWAEAHGETRQEAAPLLQYMRRRAPGWSRSTAVQGVQGDPPPWGEGMICDTMVEMESNSRRVVIVGEQVAWIYSSAVPWGLNGRGE